MKNVQQTICEVIPEGLESGKQAESGGEQVFWAHTLVQNEDYIHSAPTMERVSFLSWLCGNDSLQERSCRSSTKRPPKMMLLSDGVQASPENYQQLARFLTSYDINDMRLAMFQVSEIQYAFNPWSLPLVYGHIKLIFVFIQKKSCKSMNTVSLKNKLEIKDLPLGEV